MIENAIIFLHNIGFTVSELSNKLGLSDTTIWKVIKEGYSIKKNREKVKTEIDQLKIQLKDFIK